MKTKITALLAAALLLPPAAFAAEVGISEDTISVDFDGSTGGTANTVRYAEEHGLTVVRIHPQTGERW